MKITKKQQEQYLKDVRNHVPFSGKKKREFMEIISESVRNFTDENPDADINELHTSVGTPDEIADSFLSGLSASETKKQIMTASFIKVGAVSVTAVAVVSLSVLLFSDLRDSKIEKEAVVTTVQYDADKNDAVSEKTVDKYKIVFEN